MCMWSASSAGLPARRAVASLSPVSTVAALGIQNQVSWKFACIGSQCFKGTLHSRSALAGFGSSWHMCLCYRTLTHACRSAAPCQLTNADLAVPPSQQPAQSSSLLLLLRICLSVVWCCPLSHGSVCYSGAKGAGGSNDEYVNLRDVSHQHQAADTSLQSLYGDTAVWIQANNGHMGRRQAASLWRLSQAS